jgi:hypothetical protein
MPQAPIVNINGTSADELVRQVVDILSALREAKMTIENNGPHGRDFQTAPDGTAFRLAQSEHRTRLIRLDAMIKEYEDIGNAVIAQKENRRRYYRFHVICPVCKKTDEVTTDHRTPEPKVNCGDCLMDRTEVVPMDVYNVENMR